MDCSQVELCTARVCPPLACSVRSERNSRYLRIPTMHVMRGSSDLFSLLRIGGLNRIAAVGVRKPCAVLGLFLNRCFSVRGQSVSAEASSVEVITEKATSTGWDSVGLRCVRWFWKKQQSVPSELISVRENSKKPTTITWDSLTDDLQGNVLQNVDFRGLFRYETSSNSWKKFLDGNVFGQSRGGISEGEFLKAINHCIGNDVWHCSGYDLHSKSSGFLPPMSYLPPPDPELLKEYSASSHGGLMCAELSKPPTKGDLVVFNCVTGKSQGLPPLLPPESPVLVHILGDSAKRSHELIVTGSSAASDDLLPREVEVLDSSISKRTEVSDLPGLAFELNEHQAGVSFNGKLVLISFLEGGGRGVVALDVENGTWLRDPAVSIPWSSSNTLQLVESDGKLFISSDQKRNPREGHRIEELEFRNPKAGASTSRWRSFVKEKDLGGRNLHVHPECTSGSFKLPGIFSPLIKKLLTIALASFPLAHLPNGALAAVDQSIHSTSTSNAWGNPEVATKAVVTVLVGITMIGASVAWGIFRRRRAQANRFDIDRVLEEDNSIPNMRNPPLAILPAIPD